MVGGKIKKMCSRAVSGACSSRSRSDDADGAGPPSLIVRAERKKNTHTKKSEEKTKAKRILKNACLKHTQHDVLQQKTINDTNHYTEIST